MADTDRSNLQQTKRFIIENLRSEVMRDAYLQGVKNDPEFSDEDYEQE